MTVVTEKYGCGLSVFPFHNKYKAGYLEDLETGKETSVVSQVISVISIMQESFISAPCSTWSSVESVKIAQGLSSPV